MPLLTPQRFVWVTGAFATFGLVTTLISPLFGAEPINPLRATLAWLHASPGERSPEVDIFFYLRLPRILMAYFTGASLALVGAVFQALLRNPLAEPYTLGVATGGSFGAVVAMALPTFIPMFAFHIGPITHVHLFAFLGSLSAVFIIYLLARSSGHISPTELLLAGVVMSTIFLALILAVRYFSDPKHLVDMDRWMMGVLDVTGYKLVLPVLLMLVPSVAVLLMQARGLDQISFGEGLAASRGVDVAYLQKISFFMGSLATASVVAVAGPIGFVGLIVPHAVRRLVGPDHRLLLPCTLLGGGGFLVLCDTFARTIIAPTQLPIGIVTALLGGPFFLYLLIRGRCSGKLWGGEM